MKVMHWEEELRSSHPEESCAINMVVACHVALQLEEYHHPLWGEVHLVINQEEERRIVPLQEPRILQLQEEVRRHSVHPEASHFTRRCNTFLKKSVEERGKIVKDANGCKLCLSTLANLVHLRLHGTSAESTVVKKVIHVWSTAVTLRALLLMFK